MRQLMMACALSLMLGTAAVTAQEHGDAMHGSGHGGDGGSPATTGYEAAMRRMMEAMHGGWSGDADRDFAAGMIPHHQAAIDMARVQLEHGRDPELLRLAEAIIAAQEKEIAVLKGWLETNPAP